MQWGGVGWEGSLRPHGARRRGTIVLRHVPGLGATHVVWPLQRLPARDVHFKRCGRPRRDHLQRHRLGRVRSAMGGLGHVGAHGTPYTPARFRPWLYASSPSTRCASTGWGCPSRRVGGAPPSATSRGRVPP